LGENFSSLSATRATRIFILLKTPSKDATSDEIIEFGKKYGLGCAENITMIQSQIDDRYVLPYHFSKDQNVKKLV